ncbi:hypothetical protein GGI12_000141 [Dipsacomyces acuminosporus]|nr:hypothetical protein GGI12_000141 [Dipsacomyces acuminosporus]
MGSYRKGLSEGDKGWIRKQKMFFVATAPLKAGGHVNASPKGYDCFRILDDNRVIFLDGRGSLCEMIAHLRENKRITVMFCAFEGAPKIMRLYGTGAVHEPGTREFDALFEEHYADEWKDPGKFKFVRSIIDIKVYLVGQSCGYAVPNMEYKSDRSTLTDIYAKRSDELIAKKRLECNSISLDGIPSYLEGTDPGPWVKNKLVKLADSAAPWVGGAAIGAALALAVVRGLVSSK